VSKLGQAVVVAIFLQAAGLAYEQPAPEAHPYRQHWKHSTFSKIAVGGVAAKAAFGQLLGHAARYGGGLTGFGKRLGGGFATHTVKTTVEHVIAAPLHEDLRYHPSNKTGVRPRLWYAVRSTIITHNTQSGLERPAVGRLAGHASAGIVSQVALHAGSGAATAGLGLAVESGMNVAREFWPRHHSAR